MFAFWDPNDKVGKLMTVIRVTRLGEFSPIGSLFTLGSFMKITEIAKQQQSVIVNTGLSSIL
jgi:hypothetical protein